MVTSPDELVLPSRASLTSLTTTSPAHSPSYDPGAHGHRHEPRMPRACELMSSNASPGAGWSAAFTSRMMRFAPCGSKVMVLFGGVSGKFVSGVVGSSTRRRDGSVSGCQRDGCRVSCPVLQIERLPLALGASRKGQSVPGHDLQIKRRCEVVLAVRAGVRVFDQVALAVPKHHAVRQAPTTSRPSSRHGSQ